MDTQTEILEGYQLSPQQARVFSLQRAGDAQAYRVRCAALVEGDLDPQLFKASLGKAVERHEILRTTFRRLPGVEVPVQVILPEGGPLESAHDLSALGAPEQEARLDELFREAGREPFDYERGPLLRVSLVRLSHVRHVVLLSLPAVCADAAGLRVLLREIGGCYAALAAGREPSGEPLQYADFAQWQSELLEAGEMEEARGYWRGREIHTGLRLPFENQQGAAARLGRESVSLTIAPELSSALEALAEEYGASTAAVLASCWNVLLWRLTRQSHITTGVFFDGRKYDELKETLGLLGAHLPVECQLQAGMTFGDVVRQVEESLREARQHQEYFSWEPPAAGSPDAGSVPFCFEFEPEPEAFTEGGLTFSVVRQDSCLERFKLKLSCAGRKGAQTAEFHYDAALFGGADVERLAEQFRALLAAAAARPEAAVGTLNMVGPAERERLTGEFNATQRAYPQAQSIHKLFEEQAARTPAAVALSFRDEELTYAELDARADLLAARLRERGVGPEVLVGVLTERSTEMVVSLLAVLKAGGAYAPLDPGYPAERVRFMLEDSGARVLLTQSHLRASVSESAAEVVCVDEAWQGDADVSGVPAVEVTPDNLAYVIYTSGSTGRPKGVMISHGSICNRLLWMVERFGFSAADSVLQKTPYSFDASVWEFWVPLISGGRVVLAEPGAHRDPAYLLEAVRRRQISTLQLVPSMFDLFVRERGLGECRSLRLMFSGGEALSVETARRFLQLCPAAELTNLYGPTEVSIDATYQPCAAVNTEGAAGRVVPIGTPLANVRAYVLGGGLELAAIGEQGEVYVAGSGLARGYLGRPGLTAERFIPNPFDERGGRLYRTGDLGRRMSDGAIEYCGRADEQVKVRGHRVEIGEVEAALKEESGVAEAAVIAREDAQGQQSLVAYVAVEKHPAADTDELYDLPNGLRVAHLNRNETELIYKEVFEDECYLRHGVTLGDGACVFDVGANIGLFTLFVHDRCREARVFSFEPMPRTFGGLRANAARHGLPARLYQCGLAEAEGEARFTFYPKATAMSGRFADAREDERVARAFLVNQDERLKGHADELMAGRFEAEEVVCRLMTVSQVIAEQGVERIDLLKVDVERSELEVLRGVAEADWHKVRQVVVEVHDEDGRLEEVVSLLEGQGFNVVVEEDETLKGTGLFNLYAVRPGAAAGQTGGQAGGLLARGAGAETATEDALLVSLAGKLPGHMMPSRVVLLDKLPLLPNGKVDKGRLPAPEAARQGSGADYVAPRTAVERVLAGLWADLLKLERVGVNDDFFQLGGHSLLATQLVSRVREVFQTEVLLGWLFESHTIAKFAEAVIAHEAKPGLTEKLAGLLEMVSGMSDEEVSASLSRREKGKNK